MFSNRMSFAADEEAEVKLISTAIKAVGKVVLDEVLEKAGKFAGGYWGDIIKGVKAVGEAWVEECERAEKAAGQADAVRYINSLIAGIDTQRRAMRDAVAQGEAELIQQFRGFAAEDAVATEDGRIVGAAAGLIKTVKAGVEAFKNGIPSATVFQQKFTTAYAYTPGWTDEVRPTGTLHYEISLYKNGDEWSVEDASSQWRLVTKQANPERVAASLLESLGGRPVWEVDLEKSVKITVEEEIDWAFNKYYKGVISFKKSPGHYENGGVVTDLAMTEEAWNLALTRSRVLETAGLTGSNA
jgi:hypothetical protein